MTSLDLTCINRITNLYEIYNFSVIGLNFDFLSLNIVGFTVYGCFNVGLYFVKAIEVQNRKQKVNINRSLLFYFQDEYFDKHPTGVNPVQLNDVIFTLHAVFACAVTIFQCFIYEVV